MVMKRTSVCARRARRTHLTSIKCPPSSLASSYCQTYFKDFDATSQTTFPVPFGRTLAFSVGLTCFEQAGVSTCPPGEGTTRALVRDTQAIIYTRSGWNPANGWPTRERLQSLGLDDVADGLQECGRLG